jgi:hypothetical protein
MKNIFKKEPWNKPFSEKVLKRVAKIPTGELSIWADQALYELGRCLSSYERSRDPLYLNEALAGAEALHAVVDELHKRMTKSN